MNSHPPITVLMSVYNAATELGETIQSVLQQSFTDFEFLIINDGSTDSSGQILEYYAAKDQRIRIITQENTGLTKALNKGLSLAKGSLIARQDSDDHALPHRLQIQYDLFQNNQNLVLAGGNSIDRYQGGFTSEWGAYSADELHEIITLKTPFPHSTAMYKKHSALKIGGYDERYQTSQDFDFWIRLAARGDVTMCAEPLIIRHVGENSISSKKKFQQFKDALAIRLKHNPNRRMKALYISIRALLIAYLPKAILKYRAQQKSKRMQAQPE